MTRIDVGTLLPNEHVRDLALEGEITQLHRGQQYAEVGDTFEWDDDATVVRHRFERRE